MAEELARHDAMVVRAIEDHGGFVFAAGGDGFCAAFATASNAAECSVQIQQRLIADNGDLPIRVRIGIHTGEATERDSNYFGPEVNRAARLMACAHGGQIVVSDATEVLLRSRHDLRPLGEHRLPDRGGRGSTCTSPDLAMGPSRLSRTWGRSTRRSARSAE